jgi:AcrR family transcriptional regulator
LKNELLYRLDGKVNRRVRGAGTTSAQLEVGTVPGVTADDALQTRPSKANARERILAAAAEVAAESGAVHLSLDAIARKAGISKGGLLYHFPKKEDLMRALVEHHLSGIEEATRKAAFSVAEPNAVAAALIGAYLDKVNIGCDGPQPSGVFAALAENPNLLEPVRHCQKRIVERIRSTAADPALSLIAFLAVEGMKTLDLFETDPLTAEEREMVLATLLTRLSGAPPG